VTSIQNIYHCMLHAVSANLRKLQYYCKWKHPVMVGVSNCINSIKYCLNAHMQLWVMFIQTLQHGYNHVACYYQRHCHICPWCHQNTLVLDEISKYFKKLIEACRVEHTWCLWFFACFKMFFLFLHSLLRDHCDLNQKEKVLHTLLF